MIFYSSLAALAEFPQAVKDCFVGDEDRYSPQGVYEVRLYKEGIEEIIQLDDYIPCYPLKGPIYSKANGHELWVLLLEKAFAKYNGSYATLAAGKPFEALIDLTGMPWYEFRFSDQQVQTTIADGSLFQRLMRYDQEGFIMTITTPGLDTQSASAHREGGPATGILPGHAYTLIDAARLSNGAKLLYIRNPWGNFEWTGDWGDTSLLWTKERVDEMTKMGYDMTPKSDGAFWYVSMYIYSYIYIYI